MAISGLHAGIASSMSDLLTETKLAIGNGGLGPAWHALHVKNCPLPEIITKEPHLGKYFLKEPQMGKFVVLCQTWVIPHKEIFVKVWTNKVMHL